MEYNVPDFFYSVAWYSLFIARIRESNLECYSEMLSWDGAGGVTEINSTSFAFKRIRLQSDRFCNKAKESYKIGSYLLSMCERNRWVGCPKWNIGDRARRYCNGFIWKWNYYIPPRNTLLWVWNSGTRQTERCTQKFFRSYRERVWNNMKFDRCPVNRNFYRVEGLDSLVYNSLKNETAVRFYFDIRFSRLLKILRHRDFTVRRWLHKSVDTIS